MINTPANIFNVVQLAGELLIARRLLVLASETHSTHTVCSGPALTETHMSTVVVFVLDLNENIVDDRAHETLPPF